MRGGNDRGLLVRDIRMRYIAIDFGLKRIGVAICDQSETIVSPLGQVQNDKSKQQAAIKKLLEIIAENNPQAIVMGLPINMDGSEGRQAELTRQFTQELSRQTQLPIHFQDERLSSAAADEILAEVGLTNKKRKQKRDMLAACNILQEFLDTR